MSNKRIAIVGAGPAGLAAAKDLLTAGYSVDIFDKENFAGGVMAFGIPSFRFKMDAIEKQVAPVRDLGGVFHFGCDLKESDFLKMAEEYDYVYLAFGLTKVRHLGIPGDDLEGSLNALEFLRQYNFDDKLELTKNRPQLHGTVVVVGAGNVAMDAARVATRCGAEKTIIAYRRSRDEAPCTKAEMDQAEGDGVIMQFLNNPVEVLGKDGKVCAVKCEVMELSEPDESGRKKPVGTGKFVTIDCDYIISAIGQIPDMDVYNVGKLTTDHGYLKAVANTGEAFQTSVDNIYTGGDIVKGAKTIGVALKCGKDFAKLVIANDNK
jgi:NADPH-dependent glutamate synthase beta subunit-like oxidoreductase